MPSVNIFKEWISQTDLNVDDVTVKGWRVKKPDGTVDDTDKVLRVRELTDDEVEYWFATNQKRREAGPLGAEKYGSSAAHLVGMALVDESDKNYFQRREIVSGMKSIPRPVVDQLWECAARLSGLLKSAQEDIQGNSDSTRENDSGTTSPDNSGAA